MDVIIIPLFAVLDSVIGIYSWIVIITIVMRWLIAFNVINVSNQFVMMAMEFFYRITEPVLSLIRRFIPAVSGIDFSPFVLILILWFIQGVLGRLAYKLVMVGGVRAY